MISLPTFGTTPYATPVPSNQQVVIPQITVPQTNLASAMQQQPAVIQGPDLTSVTGMDGAKSYQTVPNARYALFDNNDDVFYIKVTDKNNYPIALKRYRFFEEPEPEPPKPEQYVTMDEFIKFKEELLNGKQLVRPTGYNASAKDGANKQQPVNK